MAARCPFGACGAAADCRLQLAAPAGAAVMNRAKITAERATNRLAIDPILHFLPLAQGYGSRTASGTYIESMKLLFENNRTMR